MDTSEPTPADPLAPGDPGPDAEGAPPLEPPRADATGPERADDEGIAPTLVGISFADVYRAQEFFTAAQGLAARHGFALKDAVLVGKDAGGRTHVQETIDPSPGRTALTGAMWAGLFGLILGGPVGWAAGLAVGAGAGAVTAKVIDLGIPDEWVSWFKQAVEPGRVIVALLVEDLDVDALVSEVERFPGAEFVYANLDPDTIDRVKAALGD
ncbi:MAG: DUF1269 domain-containing protein [Microthrixaceae bacterium]|nr:DUF1269 domain-containing protein [Microthrixaceae bacterium]